MINPHGKKQMLKAASLALTVAAWAVATVCIVGTVSAEQADRKAPITVNATEGDADHGKGLYHLEKDVVITQGTLKITGDKGTAKTDAKNQYIANLVGKQACFRQRTDNGDWAQGVADRVDYDSAKGIVELFGNANIFIGDDEHRANYIIYNTQSSQFETRDAKDRKAETKDKGRGIVIVIQPKEDAPTTAAASDAEAKTPVKKIIIKQPSPPKRNEPAFSRCT